MGSIVRHAAGRARGASRSSAKFGGSTRERRREGCRAQSHGSTRVPSPQLRAMAANDGQDHVEARRRLAIGFLNHSPTSPTGICSATKEALRQRNAAAPRRHSRVRTLARISSERRVRPSGRTSGRCSHTWPWNGAARRPGWCGRRARWRDRAARFPATGRPTLRRLRPRYQW